MKMHKIFYLFFIILNSVYANKAEEYHQYFWCNYNLFKGDLDATQKSFDNLFNKECSPYVYKGYIPLLNKKGRYQMIVKLMPTLKGFFEDDAEIQLIFAQALEATGNTVESDNLFIDLSKKFKTNNEIIFYTANSLFRKKEYHKAIDLINDFLNSSAVFYNNYAFYYLKSKIHAVLEEREEAIANIKKCLKLKPSFDRGWLLSAILHEQKNEFSEAIKGYEKYLKIAGKDTEIQKKLENLQKKTKNKIN